MAQTHPMTTLGAPLVGDRRGHGDTGSRPMTWWQRTLRESGYALSSLPLALAAFNITVTGLAVGTGLAVTLLGLPILAGTAHAARAFAYVERRRLRWLHGFGGQQPAYLCPDRDDPWLRRTLTPLRDPQSWLDLLWGLLGLVVSLIAFVVTTVWWAVAAGGLTYWAWQRYLPVEEDNETLAELLGLGSGRAAESWLYLALGVFALVTVPLATRFAAGTSSVLASVLLTSRGDLQHEVTRERDGREAARAAEDQALRRLERDIHDGPQQRLVRLSMDLGRARKQLDADPELARTALDSALTQARETVDELRSLSRGIAPPILVDRGLAVALDEVIARSEVPVESVVELRDLPPHVETAVYFVVSEALTNVAKHSGARAVRVLVRSEETHVLVEVADDGVGGAHAAKGHGLAGLEQRVRAADGTLRVTSPAGGPTLVRAEIMCAS